MAGDRGGWIHAQLILNVTRCYKGPGLSPGLFLSGLGPAYGIAGNGG